MKAIIWVLILAVIGWGIWWWVRKPAEDLSVLPAVTAEVLGESDTTLSDPQTGDAGPYDEKG